MFTNDHCKIRKNFFENRMSWKVIILTNTLNKVLKLLHVKKKLNNSTKKDWPAKENPVNVWSKCPPMPRQVPWLCSVINARSSPILLSSWMLMLPKHIDKSTKIQICWLVYIYNQFSKILSSFIVTKIQIWNSQNYFFPCFDFFWTYEYWIMSSFLDMVVIIATLAQTS